ncbi:MAG: hypothetical protein HY290_20070 [Planctomycetia bacterium]|nr:hypothetical protein [Planctomycetia bacterium]
MSFRQNHSSGNRAVTLMATCLVVLGGAITCGAIVLSADAERRGSTLLSTGATMCGIVVLLWLLRDRPRENRAKSIWGWLGRKRRRKIAYRVEARLPAAQRSLESPPAPPTAESIRAMTGRTSTWVPASTAPPSRKSAGDA